MRKVFQVRVQILPVEMLVIVLRFLKRRELDNGAIVCRRFRSAVGSITDVMRVVEKVSFGPLLETEGFRFSYVRDELMQQRNTRSVRLQPVCVSLSVPPATVTFFMLLFEVAVNSKMILVGRT